MSYHHQFPSNNKIEILRQDYKDVIYAIHIIDSLSKIPKSNHEDGIYYLGNLHRIIKEELRKAEEELNAQNETNFCKH